MRSVLSFTLFAIAVLLLLPAHAVVIRAALPFTENCNSLTTLASPWSLIEGSLYGEALGRCRGTVGGAFNIGIVGGETFANDQYAQAVFVSGSFPAVYVRMSGTSLATFDGYCLMRDALAPNMGIYRYDDGVQTLLGSTFTDVGDGGTGRLEITGTGLSVYLNGSGSPTATRTDATYGSGKGGMHIYDNQALLEDFQTGDLGGSPPRCRRGLTTVGVGRRC